MIAIKEFFLRNMFWLIPVVYLLGSFVYYTIIFEEENDLPVSEVGFLNIFIDFFIIILWLPSLVLALVRFILSGIYYLPFKLFTKLFYRNKKRD